MFDGDELPSFCIDEPDDANDSNNDASSASESEAQKEERARLRMSQADRVLAKKRDRKQQQAQKATFKHDREMQVKCNVAMRLLLVSPF